MSLHPPPRAKRLMGGPATIATTGVQLLTKNSAKGEFMGLLDNITGKAGATGSGSQNILITALMSLLANQNQGGLAGLIQQFSGSGLADIVNSWVSTGQNKPITPQQVQQGLGQDTINQLAEKTGMGHDEVKSQLSKLLPQIVDRLTPTGQVPSQNDVMSRGMDMLKGLF